MIYERAWNTAPLTKRAPSSLSPSSLLLSERLIVSMSVIWIIFFQTMIGIKSCFQMMINIKSFLHLKQCERSESESCSVVSYSLWPHGLYSPWDSPGQNTGVGSLSLLQGTFPTQGSNPCLLHCGRILYQLSHKGSPRILEWAAYLFSSRSSWLSPP